MWQGRSDSTSAKRWTRIKRPGVVVLALAMAGAFSVVGLAPSAIGEENQKKPKLRPNLVVADAHAGGSKYTLLNLDATLSFKDVTMNKGHATARHSQTAMYAVPMFAGRHPNPLEVASRSVPKLHPHNADRGSASDTTDPDLFPTGAYKLVICADARNVVRESNEHNCVPTGRKFYVIAEDYQGSLNGDGGGGGAANLEQWQSAVAHLSFGKYLGDGVFRYDFDGQINWTDAGTGSGGCTWSGGSGRSSATWEGGIRLNYADAKYNGTVEAPDDFSYPISISGGFPCGGTADGPLYPDFLTIPRRPLVFGQDELKGKFAEPGPESPTWEWDFSRSVP
jgi:hypothetical protein